MMVENNDMDSQDRNGGDFAGHRFSLAHLSWESRVDRSHDPILFRH
jgi:hypothetical protein